jgi:hypothetical protein
MAAHITPCRFSIIQKDPELVRVPSTERFDPKDQGQRREMARRQGPSSMEKLDIEMTFNEIAGSYSEEDDPTTVFEPPLGVTSTSSLRGRREHTENYIVSGNFTMRLHDDDRGHDTRIHVCLPTSRVCYIRDPPPVSSA